MTGIIACNILRILSATSYLWCIVFIFDIFRNDDGSKRNENTFFHFWIRAAIHLLVMIQGAKYYLPVQYFSKKDNGATERKEIFVRF